MRVISGEKKGLRLIGPKGKNTRPTEDRVKESIFNILMPIKSESMVLDIFSGSGQIGIEFLSRGAGKAIFIDNSRDSISIINENIQRSKYNGRAIVFKSNYLKALKKCQDEGYTFDYIYLDPPFSESKMFVTSFEKIIAYDILRDDGVLIVEHGKDLDFDNIDGFHLIDKRKYGNVDISIFNKR